MFIIIRITLLIIVIAVSVCAQTTAFAGELTKDVQYLEKAKVFSYGDVLGQATKNENYAAYKRICTNWTKLASNELDDMMKNGTPAGQLYAAALTWETNCYKAQPSKMKSGFEQLCNSKTKVIYRSGCVASEHTVGEVATAFLKKGQFQDFGVSRWCEKPIR